MQYLMPRVTQSRPLPMPMASTSSLICQLVITAFACFIACRSFLQLHKTPVTTTRSISDVDSTGLSSVVTLGVGENNPTVDVGIAHFASLGGTVFSDSDRGVAFKETHSNPHCPGIVVNLLDGQAGNHNHSTLQVMLFPPPAINSMGRLTGDFQT